MVSQNTAGTTVGYQIGLYANTTLDNDIFDMTKHFDKCFIQFYVDIGLNDVLLYQGP